VTKQIKFGVAGWANPGGFFRLLQIGVLSALMLEFQLSGHAQGNLVNLYQWRNDTGNVSNPNNYININSRDAAYFYSGITTNFFHGPFIVEPVLSGNLNTTPGITYDVSFTMQLAAPEDVFGGASMSFGSFTTNCDLQDPENGDRPGYNPPLDFSFYLEATSAITPMTFYAGFADYSDGLSVSAINVTPVIDPVPEASSVTLLSCGAIVLLFARRLRDSFQGRKRSVGTVR
jgi:hypothetical protein